MVFIGNDKKHDFPNDSLVSLIVIDRIYAQRWPGCPAGRPMQGVIIPTTGSPDFPGHTGNEVLWIPYP
jgi:hypothetical protein